MRPAAIEHDHRPGRWCQVCSNHDRADYIALWRFRTGRQCDPRRCRLCGSVFREHNCHAAER